MHTVHTPLRIKNGIKYAAVGLLFSVDKYSIEEVNNQLSMAIENFFDSLKWEVETGEVKVPEVPYGKLMSIINMKNRWVY